MNHKLSSNLLPDMLLGMLGVLQNPGQKLASVLELCRAILAYCARTEVLMKHPPVSTPFRSVMHETQTKVPSHPVPIFSDYDEEEYAELTIRS